MKFSTFHLVTQIPGWSEKDTYDYDLQVIQWADELGFDCAWIAEHHFRDYGIIPNTMLLLANIAAKTRRIRLGQAIVIMPFHHPLRAAEDAAMVDLLSGGRLNFGFGRGYQGIEFRAFEVDMNDTREKTDECMEVVLKAWEGQPFSHHGKYYNFDNVRVIPAPVQKPHPPIFFASIHPDSIRHNAKKAASFIVDSSVTFQKLEESVTAWREVATLHGHDPLKAEHTTMRSIFIGDNDEQAREFVTKMGRSHYFGQAYNLNKKPETYEEKYALESAPIDPKTGRPAKSYEYWEKGYMVRSNDTFESNSLEKFENNWIAGDIDAVIRKIENMERIGIGNIMCMFSSMDPRFGPVRKPPLPEMRKLMERFAKDVMPHFSRKPAAMAKR